MDRRNLVRQASTLRLPTGAALVAALLLLATPAVRADHIPSAQEGLGSLWWGVGFLGLIGMAFVGTIAYTVIRLSRQESAREDSRDPS